MDGEIVQREIGASMGPHSYEQGNMGYHVSLEILIAPLQWGLTLTSKETDDGNSR